MVGMDRGWQDASTALLGVNFELGRIEMMDWIGEPLTIGALVECGRAQWSWDVWGRASADCSLLRIGR